jgi:hypothetical protein
MGDMALTGRAEDLEAVIERFLAAVVSPRNRANAALWDTQFPWERDNWRAIPRRPFGLVIDPDRPFLSRLVGFDLKTYYEDPLAHLRDWLRLNLFKIEQFADDSYYAAEYRPWWGVVAEVSLFGAPVLLRSDRDPWITAPPVLQEKRDLDHLPAPDFRCAGLMPLIHRTCDLAAEVLGDRLQVRFPTWARGPLSTAMQLRGMDNLLVDMVQDGPFVHALMRVVTDGRKAWLTERARYLGQPVQQGVLFNDEVGAPIISPRLYRKFVLPYELELAEFHGGIFYWHSCGNTTTFLDDIAAIPGLRLFHVGPSTDLAEAVRRMPPHVALEICLQDVRDVYSTSDEEKRGLFRRIASLCDGRRYYVRADGFDILTTAEEDLRKIRRLGELAQEVRAGL